MSVCSHAPLIILFFICLATAVATTTCPPKYASLVLSGGGVRGALYPGALTALEEAGVLQHVKSYAGTSAGSGTAAFLAVGLSALDIRTVLAETSLKDLVDYSLPSSLRRALFGIGTSYLAETLATRKGFFSGKKMQDQFDMVIQRKYCADYLGMAFHEVKADSPELHDGVCEQFKHVTFSALPEDVDLRLTGFDITHGMLRWFDKKNTPTMPISLAIRISSGIPWMFEPEEWDGALYVDGGVLRRMPVDAFPPEDMLVMKISEDFIPIKPNDVSKMSFIDYSRRMMKAVVHQSQDLDLVQRKKQEAGIDFIDFTENAIAKSQSALEFDISFVKRAKLVEVGYSVMRQHLSDPNAQHGCRSFEVNATESMSWVKRMHEEAKLRDAEMENRSVTDLAVERNVFLFFAVTVVLTFLSGRFRNGIHSLALQKYSGIQTECCAACQRGWVPSELSYRKVNALSSLELKRALNSRGMRDGSLERETKSGKKGHQKNLDSQRRRRLRQAVYVENISFRRPWSLFYHSDIFPCRWTTKDFPVNEYIVALLALFYILSMKTKIESIVRTEL